MSLFEKAVSAWMAPRGIWYPVGLASFMEHAGDWSKEEEVVDLLGRDGPASRSVRTYSFTLGECTESIIV